MPCRETLPRDIRPESERFFDCMAARPEERDARKKLAAIPLRMTVFRGFEAKEEERRRATLTGML